MTEDTLREALEKSAAQFEMYVDQHMAKGTPEATAKAETNMFFAAMCRQAIAMETGGATESIYGKEIPAHYPDFIYDTDGLDRWREISRTGDGHDCCNANKNTVLRLVLTIDRLKAQCAAISSLKEKGA